MAFDFNDIDDTIDNGSLIIISDLINKLNKQIYNDSDNILVKYANYLTGVLDMPIIFNFKDNSNIASKVIIKKAHVDNFIKICKKFMKKFQLPNETSRTMNLIEFNENFITLAYKFLIKEN